MKPRTNPPSVAEQVVGSLLICFLIFIAIVGVTLFLRDAV
jgi:hypothetical protein